MQLADLCVYPMINFVHGQNKKHCEDGHYYSKNAK